MLTAEVNPAAQVGLLIEFRGESMQFLSKLFGGKGPASDRVALKNRFEFISQMGLGTMSKVWKAHDRQRQETVALKIIDREMQERINAKFPRVQRPSEGEVSVALKHPHIVATHEFGISTENEPFLVMEYVEGYGLQDLVERQNKAMKTHCLRWIVQIGEALTYFHGQNYIHRDFCPKNILVTKNGQIKLIDFGLVVPNTPPFQAPGNRTGTADYMAPELVKRQRTDQRIDLYSYAVTSYQMYARQLPYPTGSSLELIVKNLNRPPRPLRELAPDVPEGVERIIHQGLEKIPDDRWQTAQEMTAAFRAQLPQKS